jgi:hypothetical protein
VCGPEADAEEAPRCHVGDELRGDVGVHRRQDIVEQEQVRFGVQRTRERHPRFLSATKNC